MPVAVPAVAVPVPVVVVAVVIVVGDIGGSGDYGAGAVGGATGVVDRPVSDSKQGANCLLGYTDIRDTLYPIKIISKNKEK